MRRVAGVLAFVGFTLGLVALPATALAQTTTPQGTGPGPNPQVSGPFTGTTTYNGTTPTCPETTPIHQLFDGTYTLQSGRTGTLHLDGCDQVNVPMEVPGGVEFVWVYSGTFTLTAPGGATMNGTAAGPVNISSPYFPELSITLTPTGGTDEFKNVGGAVYLGGTWNSLQTAGVPGPIHGSLTGALTH